MQSVTFTRGNSHSVATEMVRSPCAHGGWPIAKATVLQWVGGGTTWERKTKTPIQRHTKAISQEMWHWHRRLGRVNCWQIRVEASCIQWNWGLRKWKKNQAAGASSSCKTEIANCRPDRQVFGLWSSLCLVLRSEIPYEGTQINARLDFIACDSRPYIYIHLIGLQIDHWSEIQNVAYQTKPQYLYFNMQKTRSVYV